LKQHPFQLVSMIAIALIPLIYSAVFIGSMWNPYNETGSLTVDIVNKDDGAKINGEHINIGNKLEDKLKKNDKFNWQFHKDSKAAKQNIDKG
ncbi:YhgE/Pip family protein, partial [Staphylococcus arlettae]